MLDMWEALIWSFKAGYDQINMHVWNIYPNSVLYRIWRWGKNEVPRTNDLIYILLVLEQVFPVPQQAPWLPIQTTGVMGTKKKNRTTVQVLCTASQPSHHTIFIFPRKEKRNRCFFGKLDSHLTGGKNENKFRGIYTLLLTYSSIIFSGLSTCSRSTT